MRFGRYETTRHLGVGTSGSVDLGWDPLLKRAIAVKVITPSSASGEVGVARFRREAEVAAQLSHPSIVQVLDVGEQDGQLYIVMEYMSGGDLADQLGRARNGQRVVEWMAQAAAGLDFAHERDVVHRDIKPANLLLAADHRVLKVADFSIARRVDDRTLTEHGMVVGTGLYISPEQAIGQQAQPASDRYALGIVTYQLLVGKDPYQVRSLATLFEDVLEQEPETPTRANASLPAGVDAVLLRAIDKVPSERYETASAFVADLADALGVTYELGPEGPVLTPGIAAAAAGAAAAGAIAAEASARPPVTEIVPPERAQDDEPEDSGVHATEIVPPPESTDAPVHETEIVPALDAPGSDAYEPRQPPPRAAEPPAPWQPAPQRDPDEAYAVYDTRAPASRPPTALLMFGPLVFGVVPFLASALETLPEPVLIIALIVLQGLGWALAIAPTWLENPALAAVLFGLLSAGVGLGLLTTEEPAVPIAVAGLVLSVLLVIARVARAGKTADGVVTGLLAAVSLAGGVLGWMFYALSFL